MFHLPGNLVIPRLLYIWRLCTLSSVVALDCAHILVCRPRTHTNFLRKQSLEDWVMIVLADCQ